MCRAAENSLYHQRIPRPPQHRIPILKTILSILLAAFALPAMAGDSEDALRKQLASIEKQIHQLRASQKSLYKKRSAVLKQLHAAKIAASQKKREASKKRPAKPSSKPIAKPSAKPSAKKPSAKPSPKKKPSAKPTAKKPSVKKPAGDVAKRAAESRAKFLKRFDANGDGKVTKEEAKAVLAAEAKKRAAEREKKK